MIDVTQFEGYTVDYRREGFRMRTPGADGTIIVVPFTSARGQQLRDRLIIRLCDELTSVLRGSQACDHGVNDVLVELWREIGEKALPF